VRPDDPTRGLLESDEGAEAEPPTASRSDPDFVGVERRPRIEAEDTAALPLSMQPGGLTVRIGLPTGHGSNQMGKVVLFGVEPASGGFIDLVVGRPRPSTG
jgi:hypothetical protein